MPPFSFDEMKQMRELMKDAGIRNAVVVYRRGLRAEAERKHLLAVAAQENEDTLKKTRESLDRRPLSELDQLVIVYGHLKGLARVQRDPARFTLPILPSDMSEDEYQRLRARLEDPEVLAVVKQELAKRAKI